MFFLRFLIFNLLIASRVFAADSLSYSGRLVNADGSPVSGPVTLVFDLVYTNAPAVAVCSKTVAGVTLVNGVFSRKLDFTSGECGGSSLLSIIEATPASESIAIKITDSTNSRVYAAQAVNAMPYSFLSDVSKTLVQMGASTGQVLAWDGTQWTPTSAGGSGIGTITNIATGTGLTGGPITATGTISVATGGITSTLIADTTIANIDVSTTAAIARTKLASGTASHVLVNDGSGVMSSVAQLAVTQGGTGASSVSGARTALGLGTAAVANIGTGIGGVMGSDAVPNCLASQKLQMSVGPVYAWTCATDATFSGGGLSSDIDMNSNKITELASPTVGTDAANKAYVDAQIAGVPTLQWDTVVGGHINFAGGRVGIGDTTPSESLDVAANARVAGDAQVEGKLRLKSTTANYVELSAPAGLVATRSFTLPSTLGASGEVLTTDGLGGLSWSAVSGGGGGSNWTLSSGNVYRATGRVGIGNSSPTQALEVGDTTSNTETMIKIVGNKNNGDAAKAFADIWMSNEANSGGGVKLQASHHTDNFGARLDFFLGKPSGDGGASGNLTNTMTILGSGQVGVGTSSPGSALDVKGELRLSGSSSGFVGFMPAATAGSTTYTLPNADGTTGYVLTTNGSGVLSWAAGGGGATSVGGDLSGTVSNAQIAANAVGTTEIANTSVTYAKTSFADGDIPAAKVNGLTTGLAGKEATITAGTSAQYYRGDKTMQTLDTGAVPENGNLYFLDSRVRAALMSGYAMGSALPIAATDTLLEALAKLEGSIAAVQSSGQWTTSSGNVYRTSGNVGIGTASPTGTFEVAGGTAAAATDGSSITLTAQNGGAGNEDGGNIILMPGTKTGTGTPGAVGIGMVPPAWTGQGGLAVADGIITGQRISAGSYLQFNNAGGPLSGISWVDGLTQITKDSSGTILTFLTNNLERMRVDASGNVGIGTTSPGSKLEIQGTVPSVAIKGADSGFVRLGQAVNGTGATRLDLSSNLWFNGTSWNLDDTSKAGWVQAISNDFFGIYRAPPAANPATIQELFRISNSGSLGVGVTAPTAKIHIAAGSATANTAPLKFIAGPVMTTPEDGAMEYNGTNLSFTIGATRYTVPLNSTSGVFTSTSSISNASGNIALAPNLVSGSVNITAGTSSVNSTSGALVVTGGVGIGGSLNTAGSISATSDIVGYSNVQTRNGSSFIAYNPTNDAYASIRNSAATGEANLQFLTASTARMTIDNSGRVGIGTASPTTNLQVDATNPYIGLNSTTTGKQSGVIFYDNTTATNAWALGNNYNNAGDGNFYISRGASSTGNILFAPDGNGKVGIGTSSPSAQLSIVGSGQVPLSGTSNPYGLYLYRDTGSGVSYIDSVTNGSNVTQLSLRTYNNGTYNNSLFADSNGNVGIGTNTPNYKLEVNQGTDTPAGVVITAPISPMINLKRTNSTGGTGYINWVGSADAVSARLGYNDSVAGSMEFKLGGSASTDTKMIILNGGNVGIGTTSPGSKLQVDGDIWVNGMSTFRTVINDHGVRVTADGTDTHAKLQFTNSAANTEWSSLKAYPTSVGFNVGGGADVMTILNSGNVGIGALTPANKLVVGGTIRGMGTSSVLVLQDTDTSGNNHGSWISLKDSGDVERGWMGFGADTTSNLTIRNGYSGGHVVLSTNGGNVGIGVTDPRGKLDVDGAIVGKAVSISSSPIDFSAGNIQYTTDNCGSYRLDNLKDGGAYTFVVKGATAALCSFTAFSGVNTGSLTVHLPVGHAATTASKHTIYSFFVAGADVYFAWAPGL